MEEFNFDAPIDTEIVYEDSDEDTKPIINELEVIKEQHKTYSPNKANECNNKDLPKTPLPRTVINMKNVEEFISRNSSNIVNVSSYTSNHIKDNCNKSLSIEKNIQHQKRLDMPILDDDAVDTDAFIKHICEKKTSQKPKHSKDTNTKTTQKSKKKTSTNNKKQENKLNTQNQRNTNNVQESELLFSSYTNSIYKENTLPKSKKRKPTNNNEQENRLNIQNEGNNFYVQKESQLLSSSHKNSIYKEDTTQKSKKRKPTNNNEQEKRLSIEGNNVQQELFLLNTMTAKYNLTDKSVSNANIVAHDNCNPENSNNTTNIDVSLSQREIDQTSVYSKYFVSNDKTNPLVVQNQSNKNNEQTSAQMLAKCFKDLLSTISEHIIIIMNSYQNYMKVKSHHSDPVMHQHAKMLFVRNKTYFFELTYSSVLNIIIPKENDANFVKHFIDDTIYISNCKGNRYTRAHIEPLFFEMISWVKLKKVCIENVSKKYNTPSAEVLKSILNYNNTHISAEHSAHSMQYQEGPVTEKTNVPTTGRTENTSNFDKRVHNPSIYPDTIRPQNTQVNYDFIQYNSNNLNTSYNQGIQANLQTIHGNKSYQAWSCQPTPQPRQNEAQRAQNFPSPSNQSIPKQWDCSPPVPDVSPIESSRSISRDSGFISPRTNQLVPSSEEEWNKIRRGFSIRWNFPNCIGAIDGKHINIKCPPGTGSDFFNYKSTFSIVLLACVDDDYCFTYIDVGAKGRNSDGGIFNNCSLKKAIEENTIHLPSNSVMVGDEAFPLKPYLMKPYPRRIDLSREQKIFNYRLCRCRRIVENAFGILTARFRVFERPIITSINKVDVIVKTSCALHNWLRKTSPASYTPPGFIDEECPESGLRLGTWRENVSSGAFEDTTSQNNRNSTREAIRVRDNYCHYFNNDGAVPWQNNAIF